MTGGQKRDLLPCDALDGVAHYRIGRIARCGDCGFWRRASPLPHAPRWNAQGLRVDCLGREVAP